MTQVNRPWVKSAVRLGQVSLRTVAVAYLLVLLVLLLLENTLLYPAPKHPEGDWVASDLPHEDVYFASADGTKLHGWLVEHPQPRAVLLYLHGNGDCVGYLGPYLQQLRDNHQVTIFAIDYRGYGKSEGSPFEQGILEGGHAAQMWLAERLGIKPTDIVLMGRSLGGGVAVDLAAKNGARGLILQSTFTSLPDAAACLYPWAPVRLLMKNRYDSLSKIGRYRGPVLMSHGTIDDLVPCRLGRKLYDAVPGPKKFIELHGGHNDEESPEYYQALDEFIRSLPPLTIYS
jgi:fermentation-respiration switch protein FrsA (DUF1100 family)